MHCSRRMTHSLSAFIFLYCWSYLHWQRAQTTTQKWWLECRLGQEVWPQTQGSFDFFHKKKIATFYGLPGIQTNLFLFVVHKDLYSYRYKCIINFLQCVCVWLFFFFNFLYMNFNYCGNLTRWLVFERCSLMHLGWQEDGQF